MSVIYVLLSISIVVAVGFFIAFIIAIRNGQFDDSYTPSVRILFEDELVKEKPKKSILTKTEQQP
jgi:cbb3-type cytochrome oxidase maturation protein